MKRRGTWKRMSETGVERTIFSFDQPNARGMMDQVYWKRVNTDNEGLVLIEDFL